MYVIIFLLLMCGIADAKVYIVTDTNDAVVSISEQNDAVVPRGYNVSTVKGKIDGLPISGDPTLYDFKSGSFVLNNKRVTDKNTVQQNSIIATQNRNTNRTSGFKKIQTTNSLTDDEMKAIFNE